ncbi:unnamed protein product, partial [Didymodactylos carnosus]
MTRYTQCNNKWNCLNGEDELNCPHSLGYKIRNNIANCSHNEHYCVKLNQTQLFCLPLEKVGDGRIDYLGAIDERTNYCSH